MIMPKKYILIKKILIKKLFDIFGEDKNKIEISVIKLDKTKKNYLLVSFLGILFKRYKNTEAIDLDKLEKNKQSIDGLVRYYPLLIFYDLYKFNFHY